MNFDSMLGGMLGKRREGAEHERHESAAHERHEQHVKRWKRVPFGRERDYDGAQRCGDCGVKKGMLHKRNCDMEKTPHGEQVGGDYKGAY